MKSIFLAVCLCLLCFGLCLYSYVGKHNAVMKLRIEVPKLTRTLKAAEEENMRLVYAIQEFESPQHLMRLASSKEFSHLKFPLLKEVVTLKQAVALARVADLKIPAAKGHSAITIAAVTNSK